MSDQACAVKAGAARIDLEGNPVGTVTAADEEDAQRKTAKAATHAAAKASEGGKGGNRPNLLRNPEAKSQQPTPTQPQRLGWLTLRRPHGLAERGASA